MKRVYCRCNGGHYFLGQVCPLDGWSSDESQAIRSAALRLEQAGVAPSIEQLRDTGLSGRTLERAIVVDFGAESAVFDALAPEGYVVNGEWRLLRQMSLAFK